MDELTRRQFILLSLQLLAMISLPGCRQRASLPVLGKVPLKGTLVVEDHHRALSHWAEQGKRDAVLINIDTHDDFRWIPDAKLTALGEIYRRRDWQSFRGDDQVADRNLYHIGNWIYAGARLGIFREIYWVIPYNYFSLANPDRELRQFLHSYAVSEEDIKTFALRNNRFQGVCHGMPVTICGLESLPDISAPLLLSLDVDFFPTYSSQYKSPYLAAIHSMFDALSSKNYRIDSAVLCYSVNGDYYLPPHLRWVGDTVKQALERPGLLNESPSELLTLLQQLDNAYRSSNAAEMLALSGEFLPRYQEPELLLYYAYALLLQGDVNKAFDAVMASCRREKLYATALPFIGMRLYLSGRYPEAERFFAAGYALDPKMRNGLFIYGHTLRSLGKYDEALRCYEKDVVLNGSFPTQFFIVETYALLGDRQRGVKALKDVMAGLEGNPYAHVVNPVIAGSVYAVIDFCDENGLTDYAARLKNNRVIVSMFSEFPRR